MKRKRKGKKILIILLILVLGIVLLNFYLRNKNFLSISLKDSTKIEIQNGTNGESIILKDEHAKKLSYELLKLDVKLTGINTWTCGYMYKMTIFTSNNSEVMVIKSENCFDRSIFKYETDKDIIRLIEDFVSEYEDVQKFLS